MPAHGADQHWLERKASQSVQFFDTELVLHFKAEEEVLFPAMREISAAREVISILLTEHQEMKRLIGELRSVEENASVAATLSEFAATLDGHIRKEERILFPIFEENADPATQARVEQGVKQLIGTALKPKHPELLEP
jgi:iron-sulfur cluster repair protein YtfE (RIC family)